MISREKFQQLQDAKGEKKVSIFIPTHRAGNVEKDRIRFKNALKLAEHQLVDKYDMNETQAEKFLAAAYELYERPDYWHHLSDGLAVFLTENDFYHTTLPIDFSEKIVVGDRYLLSPLLPVLADTSQFHILALSQNQNKLYAADRYSIQEICIDDLVPADMDAALLLDDPEAQVQHHSGRGGNETAIHHGQGGGRDTFKEYLKEYFDRVNEGIQSYMQAQGTPLLVACVDYEFPVYQEANTYEHLITDVHVSGNVMKDDPTLIHEKAWVQVADRMNGQQARDKQLFEDNLAADEASFSALDIVPAAINGRVEVLFVDTNKEVYGTYDQATNTVNISQDGDNLIELAALATYQAGGRVYMLPTEELPRPTAAFNAIYRYNY